MRARASRAPGCSERAESPEAAGCVTEAPRRISPKAGEPPPVWTAETARAQGHRPSPRRQKDKKALKQRRNMRLVYLRRPKSKVGLLGPKGPDNGPKGCGSS